MSDFCLPPEFQVNISEILASSPQKDEWDPNLAVGRSGSGRPTAGLRSRTRKAVAASSPPLVAEEAHAGGTNARRSFTAAGRLGAPDARWARASGDELCKLRPPTSRATSPPP